MVKVDPYKLVRDGHKAPMELQLERRISDSLLLVGGCCTLLHLLQTLRSERPTLQAVDLKIFIADRPKLWVLEGEGGRDVRLVTSSSPGRPKPLPHATATRVSPWLPPPPLPPGRADELQGAAGCEEPTAADRVHVYALHERRQADSETEEKHQQVLSMLLEKYRSHQDTSEQNTQDQTSPTSCARQQSATQRLQSRVKSLLLSKHRAANAAVDMQETEACSSTSAFSSIQEQQHTPYSGSSTSASNSGDGHEQGQVFVQSPEFASTSEGSQTDAVKFQKAYLILSLCANGDKDLLGRWRKHIVAAGNTVEAAERIQRLMLKLAKQGFLGRDIAEALVSPQPQEASAKAQPFNLQQTPELPLQFKETAAAGGSASSSTLWQEPPYPLSPQATQHQWPSAGGLSSGPWGGSYLTVSL
eukprot:TRINITY_DN108175_c0_g1_i1.p1 TRINITY_DN108175_c0_g1~~TRINITY_DN108175_c0_g1_i1.p1  ORF type:complete len:416 (-),score=95.15 TRINITY_DN108175_c0_g1_i1:109-1356(-)